MVRFAPAEPFDDETPAADPLGPAPVAAPGRRSRRRAAPRFAPTNPLLEQAFPSWARPPKQPAVGADASSDAAFLAGAGLALLDQILRADPPFAGALRQRLALRAATACAGLARHREDSSALRDAEHLSPNAGADAPTSPAGRMHRLWRLFGARLRSGLTNQACARPPICSNCRETAISKRWPGGCGLSRKARRVR
jgi:hypothetical protein